ncbi:MAG TPA: c-type cytochrome [Noviherbaspirillum sp.]
MRATMHMLMALGLATALPSCFAAARQPTSPALTGEEVYGRCVGCHSLAIDRTGPRHCGLLGRRAGSVRGFAYSEAMARSNIVWNETTLDRFLADPERTVPGTTMTIAGISDRKERASLIAYLRAASVSPECK